MALAAEFYTKNLLEEGAPVPERDDFLISKLRLAYIAYEAGDYQLTIDALNLPKVGRLIPLVTSYLMGKAYYKLDDISKAMEYFINCTKFAEHVPDVWGFLALINLQMGNNMNAISCWKYARAVRLITIASPTSLIIFDSNLILTLPLNLLICF